MPAPSRDRLAGCVIGLCLGDALGASVEGAPPEIARRYVAEVLRRGRIPERGPRSFPFGQYTDDSQLARELLRSFAERGAFDPADYAARIAGVVDSERLVGGGPGTTAAGRRLRQGISWEAAGTPAPYAGNGSAMRAGPLGLLFGGDPEPTIAAVRAQSRITHQDPRCAAGAVAIAGAVSLAAWSETIEPGGFLRRLIEWTAPIDATVSDAIGDLAVSVTLPPGDAAERVARYDPLSGGLHRSRGISHFVTTSVCWSLYAFLRNPDDYWETICHAIEVGGDTDTMAAMAGAVAGARVGLARLPSELTASLNDRGEWDYAALLELTDRCHAVTVSARAGTAPP